MWYCLEASLSASSKVPGYVSSQVKGANLGHRQNCRRVEAGKNAARPSHRSARWTGLTEGRCQEDAGNRSAAGRTARNEAWRHDAGGQKASVSGDEKTLGGAQEEGILRAASLPSRLIQAVPQFVRKAGFATLGLFFDHGSPALVQAFPAFAPAILAPLTKICSCSRKTPASVSLASRSCTL